MRLSRLKTNFKSNILLKCIVNNIKINPSNQIFCRSINNFNITQMRKFSNVRIHEQNIFVDEVANEINEYEAIEEKLKYHARKMDEGRFKEAMMDFEGIKDEVFDTASNELISWFHFLRGCCNFHMGNIREAIDEFLLYAEFELLENRRDKLIHMLELGSSLEDENDALRWFEMCSQVDPYAILPRYNLGMIYAGMKLELESFDELKKAWQLFQNEKVCLLQGKLFHEMENKDKKEELTEEELTDSYNRIGRIVALSISDIVNRGHATANDVQDIFTSAIKKFDKDAQILNAHALLAISRSSFKEAEKSLLAALKADPKHPNTHHNLASLFYRTNRLDEAIKCCYNALQLHPTFFPNIPHFYLGMCFRMKGDKLKGDFHLKESKKAERKSILDEEEEE